MKRMYTKTEVIDSCGNTSKCILPYDFVVNGESRKVLLQNAIEVNMYGYYHSEKSKYGYVKFDSLYGKGSILRYSLDSKYEKLHFEDFVNAYTKS